MFLALYYVPSPDAAYDTVQFIQQEVRFGLVYPWTAPLGASAVMVAVGLHLPKSICTAPISDRVRSPMVVCCCSCWPSATGAAVGSERLIGLLRSGTNMVASVPLVGDVLVRLLRGGESLGTLTLSRFFALHTLFLPALIVGGIMPICLFYDESVRQVRGTRRKLYGRKAKRFILAKSIWMPW